MSADVRFRSAVDFEAELRLSPRVVAVTLPVVALLLYIGGRTWSQEPGLIDHVLFVLLLYGLGAASWLAASWRPGAGRWLTLVSLVGAIYLADVWLGAPGFLALTGLATALAVPLIGLRAAAGAACVQTTLLLVLPRVAGSGVDAATAWVSMLSIWGGLGVMLAVYRPVHQVTRWSQEYFERAQQLLEEARDRQAELSQVLEDLAQANLQLTRMNRLAQGLRQVADEARAAKEQFVANVSHELRTPLNMIIGFSEMILRAPGTYGRSIPPGLLADLTVIRRNAEHLAELVDDVLDLSQIEAERMALSREEADFHEIVDDAAQAVSPLFQTKGLYLRIELPDDLAPLFCDRTRMREVLLNLLSNAGRFTDSGGVKLHVQQEGDSLQVAIADTGRGIAAEDLSRLFQPFEQADGSIHRRYGGTGLGLSISKRFIELHGGRIWVESKEGIGTTFTFRIPFRPPAPMTGDCSRWLTPHWEFVQRTRPSTVPSVAVRPRYVVLEEGHALARLLSRYADDIDVVSATSLDEAIEELTIAPSHALLINEQSSRGQHSDLGGVEWPYDVPVLTCSVPGATESTGVQDVAEYLVKPVSRDVLLDTLGRLDLRRNAVLVVDDEPDALRLFRRMLATSEPAYRVMRARNGEEALAMMRDEPPGAILLDLVMPKMDGFQLLEAKRRDPALREIPAVIISARDPGGHPIVSDVLTATRTGGLSSYSLLKCIQAIIEILSTSQPVGPVWPVAIAG